MAQVTGQHHEGPCRDRVGFISRIQQGIGFGQSASRVAAANCVEEREDIFLRRMQADSQGIRSGNICSISGMGDRFVQLMGQDMDITRAATTAPLRRGRPRALQNQRQSRRLDRLATLLEKRLCACIQIALGGRIEE